MSKSIVIVESPAKARTIEKFLGKDFKVRACAGHIKDLPKEELGVDIENQFRPTYRVIPSKIRIVRELKKMAAKSDTIFLAADPDREGEAICQHLAEELNGAKGRKVYRVLFNEITRNAVLEAFRHPGEINRHKVDAQQARRILDRLVGYQVSPLLWEKVRRGLSAGRVQSVALRIIVDREREIRDFIPEEYWNFTALLEGARKPLFEAKAVKLEGKKFRIGSAEEAEGLVKVLQAADYVVADVRKKERRKNPVPPFTTSKLQQEASRKLGFSVKKTMMLAQRLYEGVEIGQEGAVGLITYMRTDSTRVSDSALQEVRSLVEANYGSQYLPPKPVAYRGGKTAQDAHEAIRPTSAVLLPEQVKPFVERDALRLYELIWKRFVASQMNPALFDQTEIDVEAGTVLFRAVGSILRFDGFLKVYQEGRDDQEAKDDEAGPEQEKLLPEVSVGEKLRLEKLTHEQKFTQPPPRYTEATLVKALEDRGIGRPSTYAQILTVILDRDYVNKTEGRFVPTETGEVVTDLLVQHFAEIFDYDYTARLEQDLDDIERGKEDWIHTLRQFYAEFSRELTQARKEMKSLKGQGEPAGEDCEKCGASMMIRWGRFGRFVACSRYPECRNTRDLSSRSRTQSEPVPTELEREICPKCGKSMVLRRGRYGEFLACSDYPECRGTKKIVQESGQVKAREDRILEEPCPKCGSNLVEKQGRFGPFVSCSAYPNCDYIRQETTGVRCPDCGQGEIVKKRSRRGKVFFGCDRYPKCEFVLWNKPVQRSCPACGAAFLIEKSTKKEGVVHVCVNEGCDFREAVESVPAG